MSTIRPLSNNLLVKRAEAENRTPSGLYVPDKAQKAPHRGRVIASGVGYRTDTGVLIETTCEPGDIVLFAEGVGAPVTINGEELLLVSEDAVLGIVEA